MMLDSRKSGVACATVAAGLALFASSAYAGDTPTVRFGYQCQVDYEGAWQTSLPNACESAQQFSQLMLGSGATKVFQYENATGSIGTRTLEDAYDVVTKVEDADIMYFVGHGGAFSKSGASFPAHRRGLRAFSKNMRLGDEGRGLSILALQACAVGAWWPRHSGDGTSTPEYPVAEILPKRWGAAMRGGLRIVVTAWDHGRDTADHGMWFAINLRLGYPIEEAWRRASQDSHSGNDPAAFATGTDNANCWDRLSNMRLANYKSYGRLTNSAVGAFCSRAWTNDTKKDVCRASYPGCDCTKSTCT